MAATVIIGCSGTGAALARRLAAAGKPLHLLSRNGERLKALADSLGGGGAAVRHTAVDVLDTDAFEAALKGVAAAGPLEGLVYAVGSIPLKPLRGTSAAEFGDAFRLNTLGAFVALKALAPALAAAAGSPAGGPAGRVGLFCTIAPRVGFPLHVAIATAKGGVEALTRAAAAELAPRVRVNAIAPALTDTPLAARLTASEAGRKAMAEAHPLGRLGSPDDLAAMAAFLLDGAQSGWVTGQVFHVDGGRSTVRHKN
jgi:NAD(P)-dependent dehydrogenase (short-subunit alcohol dehydrogenase family)